jgi:DNA-binding MarR family transcriptional regulator
MQVDQHDFHGLLHSAELVEGALRQQLAPLGILPRQARVIEAMGRIGPVSQADLAAAFGITSASMSTMTGRLEAAGYITRAVDPGSRRRHVLKLSQKGQALVVGIGAAWSAVDDTIKAALGQDATTFFTLARQLRHGLGGTSPGDATPWPGSAIPTDPA